MVEGDASEAEAALNALLDDEACKLRILDYLRKVARRQVSALAACCEGSESIIMLFAGSNDLHLHEDFRLDQLSNDLKHERRSNIA
jgi:hypothetical protein